MAEMTRAEARAEAARRALHVVQWLEVSGNEPVTALVREELKKIEAWLRKQMMAGDKVAEKRVGKELGRQVRAPKKLERQIEALARKARGGP